MPAKTLEPKTAATPVKPGKPPQAYFDSFGGLIACEVLEVRTEPLNAWTPEPKIRRATIRVSRDQTPYSKNELIETFAHRVVPPHALQRNKASTTIKPFHWDDFKTA